jgi:hypothetical protein
MQRHVSNVHRGIAMFPCLECEYKARDKRHLEWHRSAVHLKIKQFVCGVCSFGAVSKSGLQEHVNAVHMRIRPHECSLVRVYLRNTLGKYYLHSN